MEGAMEETCAKGVKGAKGAKGAKEAMRAMGARGAADATGAEEATGAKGAMAFVWKGLARLTAGASALALAAMFAAVLATGCSALPPQADEARESRSPAALEVSDRPQEQGGDASASADAPDEEEASAAAPEEEGPQAQSAAPAGAPDIVEDYRDSFVHGDKPAAFQKYIVLHDTEGEGSAAGVIDYWDGSGAGVAAHFVVDKDGGITQCVPLDKITHHAGFGDTGHNELYGIAEDGRDDMVGTVPIGDWASDYGMNAWSVGIEMVHVGGSGYYPEEQLESVDALIAYIDAHYGFESAIIDHKAWRSGNSDTSPEFAEYLANYQDHRTHL